MQWEYRVVYLGDGTVTQPIDDFTERAHQKLRSLGVQGWELVAVCGGHIAYLKRPKS